MADVGAKAMGTNTLGTFAGTSLGFCRLAELEDVCDVFFCFLLRPFFVLPSFLFWLEKMFCFVFLRGGGEGVVVLRCWGEFAL